MHIFTICETPYKVVGLVAIGSQKCQSKEEALELAKHLHESTGGKSDLDVNHLTTVHPEGDFITTFYD